MSQTVLLITFRLVAGASVPDFLRAAETLNEEHMSRQKGYVSWEQLREGDLWADVLTWESPEDAQRILEADGPNPPAEAFYAFLDMESCETHLFSVERRYGTRR